MTDDRSKKDDAWVDAIRGKTDGAADDGAPDARIIRAAIESQDELTSERISDADIEAAKQKLMARLGREDDGDQASEDTGPEESNVVDLSARKPVQERRSIWYQNPGMLLAASVAMVAIVVAMLRDPNIAVDAELIMSYGEIDTLRGDSGETVYQVEDPDAFGRELGARLTEREIPFALTADTPDSPDRILIVQVDGVANAAGVETTLDELGLAMPSTSVLILRLVP